MLAIRGMVRKVSTVSLAIAAVMTVLLCYSLILPNQKEVWNSQRDALGISQNHFTNSMNIENSHPHVPVAENKGSFQVSTGTGRRTVPASLIGIRGDLLADAMALEEQSREDNNEPARLEAVTVPQSTSNSYSPRQSHSSSCSDQVCTEYLSDDDMQRYRACAEKTQTLAKIEKGTTLSSNCHFVNGSGRARVALASFPGSGNTWIRGMLESATGVCTGFPFCDISMRVRGFAGEGILSSAVLVVKTHMFAPAWSDRPEKQRGGGKGMTFDSAIFVVRNPFHSLVSEWNRIVANGFSKKTLVLDGHTKRVSREYFGNFSRWDKFVKDGITNWKTMVRNWVLLPNSESDGAKRHPVLIVKYEDLKENPEKELKRMLEFLKVYYKLESLGTIVKGQSLGVFQRQPGPSDVEYFTNSQRSRVIAGIKEISKQLKNRGLTTALRVDDYLTG